MAIAEMFPVGKPLDYLGCKVNINRAAQYQSIQPTKSSVALTFAESHFVRACCIDYLIYCNDWQLIRQVR